MSSFKTPVSNIPIPNFYNILLCIIFSQLSELNIICKIKKNLSSNSHSLDSLRIRFMKNKRAPTTNGNITVLETKREIV